MLLLLRLAYLLLTAGVYAVACGAAILPFLQLRAVPLLLMSLFCSWCSDVPDFFGVIAAVGISVVGRPSVVNFPTFAGIPMFVMFLGSLLLLAILLLSMFLLLLAVTVVSAVAGDVLRFLTPLPFLFFSYFLAPLLIF